MEGFSTTLEHRIVVLKTATEVVRFSFIVRKSISYLDLELCQYSVVSNYRRTSCACCALKLSNSFINTEEKCRKFFARRRSLLYSLHLDLPTGRECSLMKVPNSVKFDRDTCIPHIGKITPTCGFETSILSSLIEEAINVKNEKLKILAWILKMRYSDMNLLYVLEIQTVNKFLDCFYPAVTDSAIFKDFIMHFDFTEWMITYEDPEKLEHLLYYARHYGREDLRSEVFSIDEIVDPCMLYRFFLNIGPTLKYIDAPRFSEDDYRVYFLEIYCKRPSFTRRVLEKAEARAKPERIHWMLQIIWMYINCRQPDCTEAASEALRQIWCSVPDPYVSFKEMKAFWGAFRVKELKKIYHFYAKAVGEYCENVEPRPLQHLCRSTVRRTLRDNRLWIPEGLKQVGLPNSYQSFLNLEKVYPVFHRFVEHKV